MEINVTSMSMKHLEQIAPILLTDFDDFWTLSTLALELRNPNTYYLVALEGEEIVGFGGIWQVLTEFHLNNIVVKKTKRNQGIGTILLQHFVVLAKEKGAESLTLEVNENNKYAIQLYQTAGYTTMGRRSKYYHHQEDAIIMTKFF